MVWISEQSLRGVSDRFVSGAFTAGTSGTTVTNLDAFLAALQGAGTFGVIDNAGQDALDRVPADSIPRAIIAVTGAALPIAASWLQPRPWLSHVVSASMMDHPFAAEHLGHVTTALGARRLRLLDWLGPEVNGRRIRLARASKRADRIDRMGQYLEGQGVSGRTIEVLRDAAEELLTNAFYDAPVSAGAAAQPISRTVDVTLPDQFACDLAYGSRNDLAIVRVKDPFGSLSRRRLVEVLTRCSRTDMAVEVDESMGGAGLGMWRVFSSASFVAVSVVAGSHTEILVGVTKRAPGPRPFAFHLFFRGGGKSARTWKLAGDASPVATSSSAVNLEMKST